MDSAFTVTTGKLPHESWVRADMAASRAAKAASRAAEKAEKAAEKASRERRKAVEKASRERRKAALRSKKAAVRNTRETFKHLPGTSGGRRTRRNKSALRKTRRSRK